jgi:regulation of enolase protein 1 (concanavalin A-like superfamily)
MARVLRCFVISGVLLWLAASLAFAQATPTIAGLPETMSWQNKPSDWHIDGKKALTISSNAKTDWFVDPFDGTVANTAPILLFTPSADYVLSTKVTVKFATKWDAGALMLWGDDHHWAKLSFEYSPDGKPTLVTVVTRGLSDDCNSVHIAGDSVHLRIAKSGSTFVFYFSEDGKDWQILRTFSLDTNIPIRVGFESQSPAGAGAVATFSAITYEAHRVGNIYK